ncbi:MAG TPA: c-type cytochrome biogenesis protein CcmI [Pseudomonadales bacterium]|jgi:cytochrome c-type biogenesis protein CcmH|nr:c-type cytochrome biogenesis protein CcmI [Pseudomonadales bacterium]
MMPLFAMAIALLICLALAFILLPLRRATAAQVSEASRQQTNLALHRRRLDDLQQEHRRGEIDDAALAALTLELERDLLVDVDSAEPSSAGTTTPASLWSRHWLVLLVAGLLPLVALLLYGRLGGIDQIELTRLSERLTQTAVESPEFPALQEQLASRLQPTANQLSGWYLLASSALQNGRLDLATDTLQQIARLNGESTDNAPVYAQLAQVAFQQAGQKITPQIEGWIQQALALDPDEPTALGLLGIAAFARSDYQAAIDAWQHALTRTPAGASSDALRSGIGVARERLGLPPEPAVAGRIEVTIEIDPALLPEVSPDSHLLLFARAANGPPMPLAAVRLPVGDWPREVQLDDSMAMQPGLKLSLHPQVEVVARISRSGGAQAMAGDLEGRSGVIEPSRQQGKLKLLINQRR